jgi:hypothetical protein
MKQYTIVILLWALLLSVADTSDAGERTCRSAKAKRTFDIQMGYPNGRKGYIVDHVCALANGGIDHPKNMQYQTIENSRIKDKLENTPLGKQVFCNETNSTPTRTVFNCK